jgi:hypothetical protein
MEASRALASRMSGISGPGSPSTPSSSQRRALAGGVKPDPMGPSMSNSSPARHARSGGAMHVNPEGVVSSGKRVWRFGSFVPA